MDQQDRELFLRDLHRSLDERWRPEDVAQKIVAILDLTDAERQTVELAANAGRENFWFTMSCDFHRPCDMSRQLKVASELFGRTVNFTPYDVEQIEAWIKESERIIGKTFGKNDFKRDRLPKSERKKAGIDISRRQYNKRFRLAVRLEKKARMLAREQFKRCLTLASKNRLAANITWEDFSSDLNTASFIAYYVARCNLRSVFTNTAQARPYDEICEVLMQRCHRQPELANWASTCPRHRQLLIMTSVDLMIAVTAPTAFCKTWRPVNWCRRSAAFSALPPTPPRSSWPRRSRAVASWAWWTGSPPRASRTRARSSGARTSSARSATSCEGESAMKSVERLRPNTT